MKISLYVLTAVFLLSSAPLLSIAQSDSTSLNDTAVVKVAATTSSAPPIMAKKWNHIQNRFFTMNIGLAFLLDHNEVSQDADNIEQVGKVGPGTEFRGERFVFSGALLPFKNPWKYMISLNFNGLDRSGDSKALSIIDLNFEIPLGKDAGWLTIGKQKEGVGHEYIAPGTQLSFMERGVGAPMFIRQRNTGVRYSNNFMNQRISFTFGLFNNWFETGKTFKENGSQVTARVSALAMYKSDADLMHLAVGYRYTDATSGKLNYKARPEVNTAPSFINTGSFDATSANTLMLEWIKVNGPVSFTAEYMNAFVNSSAHNNPSFSYWQVGGSWFITGEHRRYNKQTGNLGKLIPNKNFRFKKGSGPGAFELAARLTHANGTDEMIYGGKFSRMTGAVSWYPNAHFRFSINYGHATLKSEDLRGSANFWQFRTQFEL